jgi:hypothetical protein
MSAQPSSKGSLFWNLLTLITLGILILVLAFLITIFVNPASAWNPFPPPNMPQALVLPTATPTLRALPPTWTPTLPPPTETVSPTPTLDVPLVTVTVLSADIAATATEVPTPSSGYAFTIKSEPVALDGSIFHPDWECRWMGAAGQVEDIQGRPAKGIRVLVSGRLNGEKVEMNSLTGTALQYGPAGFEFLLAEAPVATSERMWLQLLDQAGLPLSAKVYFDTFDACDQNLVLINFKQVR